jgi:hypothetical protein
MAAVAWRRARPPASIRIRFQFVYLDKYNRAVMNLIAGGFYLWIYNKLLFWARAARLIQSTPVRSNKYVKMFRDNGSPAIPCRIFELPFVGIVARRNGTQISARG